MVKWRPSVARSTRWLAASVLVLAGIGGSAAEAPTEYELKAIFLYNFTKYVEWEQVPAKGTLALCVLGEDPFGAALDGTIEGETVQGRRLVARRIRTVEEALSCQVVFVADSEEARLGEILGALAGKTVLTVGETEGFAVRGGVIHLREDESRIRIVINVDAANRAGLRISSQLLKLGEVVGGER